MHISVDLSIDLSACRPLTYEPKDLPVRSEGIGWLNAFNSSPIFPSTLLQRLIEEGVESAKRDHLVSILSDVFTMPIN